MVKNPNFPRKN
uniref:Uncharacterized protein n=1 Tax=Arundo donax TaxID=35708 RepID=A0A0A9BR92_ARUDO